MVLALASLTSIFVALLESGVLLPQEEEKSATDFTQTLAADWCSVACSLERQTEEYFVLRQFAMRKAPLCVIVRFHAKPSGNGKLNWVCHMPFLGC